MMYRKAFTLAEILIVLVTIGVISAVTIPAVMKGVMDAQLKTAYKKAYHVVSNIITMEKATGSIPTVVSQGNANRVMYALNNALSVTGYIHQVLDSGVNPLHKWMYPCAELNFRDGTIVTIGDKSEDTKCLPSNYLPQRSESDNTKTVGTPVWIVSEDEMAYTVLLGGMRCYSKEVIQSQKSLENVIKKSCFVIVVDVNGIGKGPNSIEPQTQKLLDVNESMDVLTGDRFQIYVGTNGVTAGPRYTSATGRIISGLK